MINSAPTPSASSSPLEGVSSASAALLTVRKHWPTVLASALLFAGAALLISKSMSKVYDSTALVELNASVIRPLGDKSEEGDTAGIWWDNSEYYETQYRIVTSQRVLGEVVRNLNLVADFDFHRLKPQPGKTLTVEEVTSVLRSRVRVEPIKNSRLFTLHVEDTNPKRARMIASAIANTFVEQNLQKAITGSSDAVVWLSGQLDHVKSDLEASENALHQFKEQNELPSTSINEASNMIRLEMQEYDTALTKTRTKKQELLARYDELSKLTNSNPDDLPSSELLSDTYLQKVREQYLTALKERDSLLGEGKGENHPLVKAADERVAQARSALLAQVNSIRGAVERDLAVVKREETGVDSLFDAARKRAVDLNMKEIEYRRLDRAREQNEKLFAMLLEREKQADLERMMRVNNIRLVDDALEPERPIRPRTALNLVLGLLLGLLTGVGLSWLRERLDSSLKTPDDLEARLGLTFLGMLPELDERSKANGRSGRNSRRERSVSSEVGELTVHHHPLSGMAEAARAIRTNLMFMNPDRPYRRLLVTSAAPSEGKTTVACSIAIAFAQGGQRVCIVDCDLRRPRVHRIFQRAGDAGVTNVLVGEVSVDDVAKPTGIDNLWAIPAGPTPPNPADMLHSDRFKRFLEELSERFDRVVLDSPPLVPVTDSAIISTLVDGTVFVVRAFNTSRHLSAQGLRVLRDVDTRVIGAVLNAVNLNRHEYSYYYHYYYYKREGYSRGASDDAAATDVGTAAPPN